MPLPEHHKACPDLLVIVRAPQNMSLLPVIARASGSIPWFASQCKGDKKTCLGSLVARVAKICLWFEWWDTKFWGVQLISEQLKFNSVEYDKYSGLKVHLEHIILEFLSLINGNSFLTHYFLILLGLEKKELKIYCHQVILGYQGTMGRLYYLPQKISYSKILNT